MKENKCHISYKCVFQEEKDCCYFLQDETEDEYYCRYNKINTFHYKDDCTSKVAQVNRLILDLQSLTGKKVELK